MTLLEILEAETKNDIDRQITILSFDTMSANSMIQSVQYIQEKLSHLKMLNKYIQIVRSRELNK